ncbi:MAG: GTP pyrophosphokinase family protein [Ruminococcus sp.]|uniref:GTP pyrophosphokinase n=1 Tax=Ruminococcus sp. TaxID=41978 RepID=UPI0025F3FE0A|nr:GTP pyrophosphokinase family protein [Ruminococcus sp.]MBR5683454.1 GTP pyrophosphokinase family protein [Ruminococcus sp.]
MDKNKNAIMTLHEIAESDMSETEFLQAVENNMIPLKEFFTYYKCAIMEIETKFRVLNQQFSINGESNPIEFIQSRIKSYGSIFRKMIDKNIPRTLDSIEKNVSDIAGIRVVCSFVQDIYHLADCFLSQDDIFLIEKKDYIKNPKPNGYRSLHLIVEVPIFLENEKRLVRAEVQLRTIAMDFWASLEHKLRYKKDLPQNKLDMLTDDLKKCADQSAEWDIRMQDIKNIIENDQV